MKTYIKQIEWQYYAFAGDSQKGQVYSIGSDKPSAETGGTIWFAEWTDNGIKYVASPSPSREAAYRKAKRHGEYAGEI